MLESQWLTDTLRGNQFEGPIHGHKLSSGTLSLSLKANQAVTGKLLVVAHGPEGQTRSTEFDLKSLNKGSRTTINIPVKQWLRDFEGGITPVQVSYSSELYDQEGRFLRNEPGGVLYLGQEQELRQVLKNPSPQGAKENNLNTKQAKQDWIAYDVESLKDLEDEHFPKSAEKVDPSGLTSQDLAALSGFDPRHSRVVGFFDAGGGVLHEAPDQEGVMEQKEEWEEEQQQEHEPRKGSQEQPKKGAAQ